MHRHRKSAHIFGRYACHTNASVACCHLKEEEKKERNGKTLVPACVQEGATRTTLLPALKPKTIIRQLLALTCKVNRVILGHECTLLCSQARVREHANLIGDVVPVFGGASLRWLGLGQTASNIVIRVCAAGF